MDPVIIAFLEDKSDAELLEMVAMIDQDEEKDAVVGDGGTGYVSCITINNQPILPPIMTESVRAECRNWRQKAVEGDFAAPMMLFLVKMLVERKKKEIRKRASVSFIQFKTLCAIQLDIVYIQCD